MVCLLICSMMELRNHKCQVQNTGHSSDTENAQQMLEFSITAYEGDQSFVPLKLRFWDINFKLVMKKQKTQKEPVTSPPPPTTAPHFPAQDIQTEKPASGRKCKGVPLA